MQKILYKNYHIKVATIRWIKLWSVMQFNTVQCCVPVQWYAKWAHTVSLGLTTRSLFPPSDPLRCSACNAVLWPALEGSVVQWNEDSVLHCSAVHLSTILSLWLDTKHTTASLQPPATAVNCTERQQGTSLISIYIFFLYELKIYLITLTKIVQILG